MTPVGSINSSDKITGMTGRIFRRYFPLIFIMWILFVLYPNPLSLFISLQRVCNFDARPGAVEFMLSELPSDPVAIEQAVLARISYRHDWELYSMPWYFPTIEKVLEQGEGDCKARALVLASILKAKNIPYQVNYTPIHVWVEYEGKRETSIENTEVNFSKRDPETGERQFQIPKISVTEVMDSFWQAFWWPMPDGRKALLISGLLALVTARVILSKKRTA